MKLPRLGEATELASNRKLSEPPFHFGCVFLTGEAHKIGSSAHHAPVPAHAATHLTLIVEKLIIF